MGKVVPHICFNFLLTAACVLVSHLSVCHGILDQIGENRHIHTNVIRVSSLLPPTDCSITSKGPNKRSSLQVFHRHGPCSQSWQVQQTSYQSLEQILLQDQIRVQSLQQLASMKSHKKPKKGLTRALPVNLGTPIWSGLFQVRVGFGTPTTYYSVSFDTGSDLTWIQCQPCIGHCHSQQDPIFNPSNSTSYFNITCAAEACSEIKGATGDPPRCYSSTCGYGIIYGDGSFSAGFLASETLTLKSDVFPKFLFGCGQNNDGIFGISAGLLGLGRGSLSLTNQTAMKYERVFSYCLPSIAGSTGSLTFGGAGISPAVKFTPLLADTRGPSWYYLDLIGITVGGRKLAVSASIFAAGGTIIDSGSVISRLPKSVYAAFRDAFRRLMSSYPMTGPLSILDTCYNLTGVREVKVPKITLLFRDDVEVELDSAGVLISKNNTSQVCLAFHGNNDDNGMNIFGNWQQQKLNVVYDLARQRVGLGPGDCS